MGPLIFVVLVSRTLITSYGSRAFRFVLSTAMMAVALRAMGASAQALRGGYGLDIGLHLLAAAGFTFVVIELLRRILASGPVDADKLYAAVSAYLMMGLAFASLYETIALWKPTAFAGASAADHDALFYFSLVTLSTVGYGDVVPNLPETRVLAVTEAISGQFYLAILLARLVGLHLSQATGSPSIASGPASSAETRANDPEAT